MKILTTVPPKYFFFENINEHCQVFENYCSLSIYISEQLPPPGPVGPLGQYPSVGYHWIRLDPQGPKIGVASRISGPDQRGRRRQVPGGPEPGHPQESIFWKSVINKVC